MTLKVIGAVLGVGIAMTLFPPAMAQDPGTQSEPAQVGDAAQYGRVSLQISCLPDARTPFQQGLALLHSFWFEAARKAFQQASNVDPACAMA